MVDADSIMFWKDLSERISSQIEDEKKQLLKGLDSPDNRLGLIRFISHKEIPFFQKQKMYFTANLSQVNLFHTSMILDLLHFQLELLRHPDTNNACQVVLSTQKRIEHSKLNIVK
ncbi:hypothetical protein JW868_04160 [Candidatus Woesearchaeota archaeon]|nr:hypothetical protein [Candidatus Woesearchaeota archaeon]